MTDVTMQDRFLGAVRLVMLHLWRLAKTTDLEVGLAEARARGMLDGEQEAFVREAFEAAQLLEEGGSFADDLDEDTIHELQLCAIRLNTADPA